MKNRIAKATVVLTISLFSLHQAKAQPGKLTKVFNKVAPPPPRINPPTPSLAAAPTPTPTWSSQYSGNSFPNVSNISGSFNRAAKDLSTTFNKAATTTTTSFNKAASGKL